MEKTTIDESTFKKACIREAVNEFVANSEKLGPTGVLNEFRELKTKPQNVNATMEEVVDAHEGMSVLQDVPCIDATRVVLMDCAPGETNYIHASRVKIDGVDREWIVTQAPMQSTAYDFWRMIYQEKAVAIVAIFDPSEGNNTKPCIEYWKKKEDDYVNYEKIMVKTRKIDKDDRFLTYTIEVLPDGYSNSELPKLMHVTSWPDRGVPESARMVLRILQNIRRHIVQPGPAVVHCAAGIGRSGVLVAVHIVTARLYAGKKVTVPQAVMELREQRAHAVQSDAQYVFIYRCVLEYIGAKSSEFELRARTLCRLLK